MPCIDPPAFRLVDYLQHLFAPGPTKESVSSKAIVSEPIIVVVAPGPEFVEPTPLEPTQEAVVSKLGSSECTPTEPIQHAPK